MPRPAPFVYAPMPAGSPAGSPAFTAAALEPATATIDPMAQNKLLCLGSNSAEDAAVWAPRIRALLAQGARLDAVDVNGRTPLHVATWKSLPGLVHALLDAGARADVRDKEGATPLTDLLDNLFVGTPDLTLIRRLVEAGANPNGYLWMGWARFTQEQLGENLPLGDGEWLHAPANGLPLTELPPAPAQPPADATTLEFMGRYLHSAFSGGRVQRLTPLALALRLADCAEDAVQALLDVGADPLRPVGFGPTATLFHAMVAETPLAVIDQLLDRGVLAETLNGDGKTPAQVWAASEDRKPLADHLARRLEQRALRQVAEEHMAAAPVARERARL